MQEERLGTKPQIKKSVLVGATAMRKSHNCSRCCGCCCCGAAGKTRNCAEKDGEGWGKTGGICTKGPQNSYYFSLLLVLFLFLCCTFPYYHCCNGTLLQVILSPTLSFLLSVFVVFGEIRGALLPSPSLTHSETTTDTHTNAHTNIHPHICTCYSRGKKF